MLKFIMNWLQPSSHGRLSSPSEIIRSIQAYTNKRAVQKTWKYHQSWAAKLWKIVYKRKHPLNDANSEPGDMSSQLRQVNQFVAQIL